MIIGHGGDIYSAAQKLGCVPSEIMDFSSNVAPLPLKQDFLLFLEENIDAIRVLPEPDSLGLRQKLGARYGLSSESFLVGNGTTEWIFDIPLVFDFPRVVIPIPTYSDYEDASKLAEKEVKFIGPFVDDSENAAQKILETLEKIVRPGDIVFICNPNNPTGHFFQPKDLIHLIGTKQHSLWIIDESYVPFVDEDEKASVLYYNLPENCLVLRSFSKIYGIPGLRLGFIVGEKNTIQFVKKRQRPWSVGRMAQIAGEYLIQKLNWEVETRDYLKKEKNILFKAIDEIPFLHPISSLTHFFLVEVNYPMTCEGLYEKLLAHKILIRMCKNFRGLENREFVRISPRSHEENQTLLDAIKKI